MAEIIEFPRQQVALPDEMDEEINKPDDEIEMLSGQLLRAAMEEIKARGLLTNEALESVFETLGPKNSIADNMQALANAIDMQISDLVQMAQARIDHDDEQKRQTAIDEGVRTGTVHRL